jgi:hypothetical protein
MKAKRDKQVGASQAEPCTAPYCRKLVGYGFGIQFVDDDGKTQRYCWECWSERCAAQANWTSKNIPPHPPSSPTRADPATIVAGVSTPAAIVPVLQVDEGKPKEPVAKAPAIDTSADSNPPADTNKGANHD